MQNPTGEPEAPKLHEWTIRPKQKVVVCDKASKASSLKPRISGPNPITWTVSDIAKAGRLLSTPPLPTSFEDEQEMRRVYTLIYDVFRYKNVLAQALSDIAFFQIFPQLSEAVPHVWLLSYDLYHRSFKKRETAVAATAAKLFEESGLTAVEAALWQQRVKLAASIARLRIEHNALSLSDLLPHHLRDERVTKQAANAPVTCWVNTRKVKNSEVLRKQIEKTFSLRLVDAPEDLSPETYKWDRHCPQIVAFHGSMRTALARSELVRGFKLVVQDKSFCLGPATFGKLVQELELTGSVIQTHVNSPRTTAYLASLLFQNEKINKLMAFSAGKRKIEYEAYFSELGMTNIRIFADRLIDVSPDANYMEEVVAVFATPPNSYSSVNDPIDLVCSRGGDLSMLEILTESEETKTGKERVNDILDEQRKTLRFAMSRPQIQFVLYETHSELDIENNDMIQRTVKEVNRIAKLHHATLQGRIITETQPDTATLTTIESREISDNPSDVEEKESEEDPELKYEKSLDSVSVPDTDIFDVPNLPNLCPGEISCMNLAKEGCYLALLQRKKVIRLDNKYMIQMAENRGLFGRTSSTSSRAKGSKGSRKKQEKPPTPPQKTKRRIKDAEVSRIAAPTHTFLRHTKQVHEISRCPRCLLEEEEKKRIPQYRQWWSETTRHIMALKSTLVKNKAIPPNRTKGSIPKSFVNSIIHNSCKIDEIAASSREANMPVFPKLRLTRNNHRIEKVPLQLPITFVEFMYWDDYHG